METLAPTLIAVILFTTLLLLAIFVGFSKPRGAALQLVYLIRYPLIFALTLLLLPLLAISTQSKMLGNIFTFDSVGAVALVVWIAILVAWTVMYTSVLVLGAVSELYGLPNYLQQWRAHPRLRRLDKWRVVRFALLALPIVVVTVTRAEIAGNAARSTPSLLGAGTGVILALLAAAVFYWLMMYLGASQRVQRFLMYLRQRIAQLADLIHIPSTARSGFRNPDETGFRHETATIFLFLLAVLYVAGAFLFNPNQHWLVIQPAPAAVYLLSLLLILAWVLSGVAHLVDRYRVPTSLLILILTYAASQSPYTQHHYQITQMPTPTPSTTVIAQAAPASTSPDTSLTTPLATPPTPATVTATVQTTTTISPAILTAVARTPGAPSSLIIDPFGKSPFPFDQSDFGFLDDLPFPDAIWNAQIFDAIQQEGQLPEVPPPMIIVMSSGGGIQSAVWTARVLTGLQRALGPDFARNISLISAVSGGTVGTMYYVDGYAKAGPPPPSLLDEIVIKAGESTVEQAAWGLFYPDLWRTFLGGSLGLGGGYADRSWAMETAWRGRLQDLAAKSAYTETQALTTTRMLSDWQQGVNDGWRPAVIFNATEAETGERFLFATGRIPITWTTRSFYRAFPGYDIPVATAARMASTFPYVSPLARARLSDAEAEEIAGRLGFTHTDVITDATGITHTVTIPESERVENWNLADGGYFDNDGVVTGLQWLKMILESSSVATRPQRIVIIQILASSRATEVERCDADLATAQPSSSTVYTPTFQPTDEGLPSLRGSWVNEFFGPVLTLLSSWGTSQVQRGQTEIDTFIDLVEDHYENTHVLYCVFDLRDSNVLSWHLSPSEFDKILKAWGHKEQVIVDGKSTEVDHLEPTRIAPRVKQIARFLGLPYLDPTHSDQPPGAPASP